MPMFFWCWKLPTITITLPHLITYNNPPTNPPVTLIATFYHIQHTSGLPYHFPKRAHGMLYHCMLTGSWHGSVNMAFMTCWIHDWFMTGWWLVVQDLWHVEESMAWIRKLWHKQTVACWRVHGMAQQSWHSWLVGFMVGSWLVHDSLFRIYGMLKSPWHESENYGITTVACWRVHGMVQHAWHVEFVMANQSEWLKKTSALPLFQRLLRQNQHAWPVYLLEQGNLGAIISIGPWHVQWCLHLSAL